MSNDARVDGGFYTDVQKSEEFVDLKRRFRRFVFPMTAFFLAWYFLYVFLAIFATGFMSTIVVGNINVGLIFGLQNQDNNRISDDSYFLFQIFLQKKF